MFKGFKPIRGIKNPMIPIDNHLENSLKLMLLLPRGGFSMVTCALIAVLMFVTDSALASELYARVNFQVVSAELSSKSNTELHGS
jgi:hypothetical protein